MHSETRVSNRSKNIRMKKGELQGGRKGGREGEKKGEGERRNIAHLSIDNLMYIHM